MEAGDDEVMASVIVPISRYETRAEKCLEALLGQDFRESYEIILSLEKDHPQIEFLKTRFPSARLVYCPMDAGPGGGRNYGIQQAGGVFLVFVDADCVPRRDWLTRMVAACRAHGGGPVCGWMATNGWLGLASDLAERGTARPRRPITIPALLGSSLCVARRMTAGKSKFIENLYGSEELGLLEGLPGAKVVLDPSATGFHFPRQSLRQSLRRMYAMGKGSGIMRKNPRIRGSFLMRHRWLLPLLPAGRLALTFCRLLRCRLTDMLAFAVLWPVVLCHWVWYTAGVAAIAFGRQGPTVQTGGFSSLRKDKA
jgi:glycosyltransferase involved in cell wall biosynthesis